METRLLLIPVIVFSALFNLGCSKVDSSDLKTSGMYATLAARDDGTTVAVTASLSTGPLSNDTVKLSAGDSFSATFNAQTKAMTESQNGIGKYVYTATFGTLGSAQATINFQRDVEVSAPNSTVTLPTSFTLTHTAGTNYSMGSNAPINFTWDTAASGSSVVSFYGTCNSSLGSIVVSKSYTTINPDPLTYTIGANDLATAFVAGRNPTPVISNCNNLLLKVSHTTSGTVDSNFGQGGTFTGEEYRTSTFNIIP